MSISAPLPSWLFAPAPATLAASERGRGGPYKNDSHPHAHIEVDHQQHPCTQIHSSGAIPSPLMNDNAAQAAPAQDPIVLPSSCLRRRISDSSSTSSCCGGDSDEGESDAACTEKRGNDFTASLPKAKRRRRLRVGFKPQIVQKVHPYPQHYYYTSADADGRNDDTKDPPPASVLWYTHSELLAMKRIAKRTCFRNRDALEYALNDAYQRQPQRQLADAAEISDDSEQETAGGSLGGTALTSTFASSSDNTSTGSSTSDERGDDDDISAIQQHLLSIPAFRELRGMERWSSQCHALSRGLTMLQVKTEVFVWQAQHSDHHSSTSELTAFEARIQQPPTCLTHAQHGCQQRDQRHALELARACSEASAPAMRFARLMGRLDEAVARETPSDDSSDELQEREAAM